jgi:hypothetical protein
MPEKSKKSIQQEFETNAITACYIKYKLSDFKKLNIKSELKQWMELLNDDSYSYPTYLDSQYQEHDLKFKALQGEDISDKFFYVIPHYFKKAKFSIDEGVTNKHIVWLAPTLGELLEQKPMSCIVDNDLEEEFSFWELDSSEPTNAEVSFYHGKKLKFTCELEAINEDKFTEIISKL